MLRDALGLTAPQTLTLTAQVAVNWREARRRDAAARTESVAVPVEGTEIRGFGVSSISQTERTYRQTRKSLEQYYDDLAADRLPVERGLELSDEDILRRHIIMRLMCDFRLDFAAMEKFFPVRFAEKFSDSLTALREFAADGLIELTGDAITVTDAGRLLIRNIAMCFDAYAQPGEGRHSKTI